ncbi:MAG: VCBS repeat-containing protein, partial [bacterium]|nr:VCBS repeat-containing protein [bacterium]
NVVDDTFTDAVGVCVADIDGDTDLDVVGTGSESNEIAWWANDGSGGGWTKTLVDDTFQGGRFVRAADLDGDGDLDIIATGAPPFSGRLAWWSNDDGVGGSWTYHSIASYSNAWEVSAADVDGDTDLDIICASGSNDSMTWWSNNDGAGGSWTSHAVSGTATGGYYGALGVDMDGDSDIDIVGTAWNAGTVVWWENTDGSGSSWTEHIVSDAVSNPRSVYAVDLDGDSDLDLVVAAFVGDNVSCWENVDGKGTTWTEGVVVDGFDSPQCVFAVDMDADTDSDILGSSLYDNVIVWWENDGSGGGWSEHPVATDFNMASDVCADDLDGDSAVDVRAADDSGNMGTWSEVSWGADLGETYPAMLDYLQYMPMLTTTDPQVSPTLLSVDICPYFHLVSPTDASVVNTLTPTLDWDDTLLPDFDTYTLWWGTDPTFDDHGRRGITFRPHGDGYHLRGYAGARALRRVSEPFAGGHQLRVLASG